MRTVGLDAAGTAAYSAPDNRRVAVDMDLRIGERNASRTSPFLGLIDEIGLGLGSGVGMRVNQLIMHDLLKSGDVMLRHGFGKCVHRRQHFLFLCRRRDRGVGTGRKQQRNNERR